MAELRSDSSTLWKRLLLVIALMALPHVALAQGGPNLLQAKGYVAEHNWFSPFDWEHFDAVTGNIMLTFTDLTLPGNGGRELRFQRVFNSHRRPDDKSGWQFGFPGMVMKILEKGDPPDYLDFQDDISGITLYTPRFIMADGAEHPTAYMSEPNGHTAVQLRAMTVISGQFLKYSRPPAISQSMGTLYMPDGTVCHYAPDDTVDQEGNPYWTLRDFADPFGNIVTLSDGADPDGMPTRTVTQSLGNGQSRQVVFRLNTDGTPSSMTYEGRIWQYQYTPVTGGMVHELQTFTPPTGPAWTFAYDSTWGAINNITLPGNGHVHYDYTA
jgi:hypothetical protein